MAHDGNRLYCSGLYFNTLETTNDKLPSLTLSTEGYYLYVTRSHVSIHAAAISQINKKPIIDIIISGIDGISQIKIKPVFINLLMAVASMTCRLFKPANKITGANQHSTISERDTMSKPTETKSIIASNSMASKTARYGEINQHFSRDVTTLLGTD